jgi:predicted membrane-bound dolichyl-phosphate-mannose-protein mannosyltransferase
LKIRKAKYELKEAQRKYSAIEVYYNSNAHDIIHNYFKYKCICKYWNDALTELVTAISNIEEKKNELDKLRHI